MVSGIGSGDVLDYFFEQSQNKPKGMIESGAESGDEDGGKIGDGNEGRSKTGDGNGDGQRAFKP